MQNTTIVVLLFAILLSLALVWFQYFFKKKRTQTTFVLAFLRFLAVLGLLVLLINPKYVKNSYTLEKANLSVVVDNSSSIKTSGSDVFAEQLSNSIINSEALSERFKITTYAFDEKLNSYDSLSFDKAITNIAKALATLNDVNDDDQAAILLLTDGNQTLGADYEFQNFKSRTGIYPVVLGDTTAYEDLRIGQVNFNKYAFLKNQFPIEFTINYAGRGNVNTIVRILMNSREVYRQPVNLTSSTNSQTLSTLLEANNIGVKNIQVKVDPFDAEQNKRNNSKTVAIEVVDERTNVTIVSSIKHPDIGMFKKSIETNEQRVVNIIEPNYKGPVLEDTDIFLLYQPNRSFLGIYNFINKKGGSIFTITGPKTDWGFLNQIQNSFSKEDLRQSESIFPDKNAGFGLFDLGSLSFEDFPPLDSELGEIIVNKSYETIAFQRIKGATLDMPLLISINDKKAKEAVLFGEGIWKWRVQTYRNEKDFTVFDDFIAKIILYLSDSSQKSRLEIDYEMVYDGLDSKVLRATYFDESYVFDPKASLTLKLVKSDGSFSIERPMLLKTGTYESDLGDLDGGEYQFSVTVNDQNIKKSGQFTILEFDLEGQFLSANYEKLSRLAERTNGKLFYPDQTDELIELLINDSRYTPVQKSTKNVVSLIDFRWLLALIIVALTLEWFIRKYNGLL